MSYDRHENSKKVDLAQQGEEGKWICIVANLSKEEEEDLSKLLKEYRDVFAWSYKDLKAVEL